jgi:hypothetical protein
VGWVGAGKKLFTVAPGSVLSNHFDPRIIGEIRAFQDILDGVESEKKVRKRPLETSRRAIPHMRFSNLKDRKGDVPPKAGMPDDDAETERKLAA